MSHVLDVSCCVAADSCVCLVFPKQLAALWESMGVLLYHWLTDIFVGSLTCCLGRPGHAYTRTYACTLCAVSVTGVSCEMHLEGSLICCVKLLSIYVCVFSFCSLTAQSCVRMYICLNFE